MSYTSHGQRVPWTTSPRVNPFLTVQQAAYADPRPRRPISTARSAASQTYKKSPRYRTINSRCGNFALLDETTKTPRKKSRITFRTPDATARTPIIDINSTNDLSNTDEITLETLNLLAPANYFQVLLKVPLFLRALRHSGSLNPDVVMKYTANLPAATLQKYVQNFSHESGIYAKVTGSETLAEVEAALMEIDVVQRATVWTITETEDAVVSPTTGEVLPLRNSIVGYSILKNVDVVTGDPGDHPGFSVDNDIQFLRNCKALMVLPIVGPYDETVAALQVVGQDPAAINKYYQEVFRIVRDIVHEMFFLMAHRAEVDASVTAVVRNVEEVPVGVIAARLGKFLQETVPCELAEIYQFDARQKTMVRLTDGQEFNQSTGGIAFVAGLTRDPVVSYHHHRHPSFNPDIDGRLTNKSVMALSLFSRHMHYVVALRAKWRSPSFVPQDVSRLRDAEPVICDMLRFSSSIQAIVEKDAMATRRRFVVEVLCDSVQEYWGGTVEPHIVFSTAARKLFGSQYCFVCEFTGAHMKYYPSGVTKNYDECISGRAYNYRRIITFDANEFDSDLYQRLGVNLKTAVAFPFRSSGQVVGAIELINYKPESLDDFARENIGSLASFLYPNIGNLV